jgi:hypothetical protein
MKHQKIITVLVFLIAVMATMATTLGIFSYQGPGPYEYESIRGEMVTIYGRGLYQHMSADVAIQGIAQDYITFGVGVILLLISLFWARKNSLQGLFLLSGTLGYFLVTYLFYTAMGMYNVMFLAYVFLLSSSFFAFILTLFSYDVNQLKNVFLSEKLLPKAGIFLIVNASLVTLLWLSVIVPPLLNGTIIPVEVQHYTTLIVQGFDLGLFLPMAFVVGLLALKKNPYGYLFTIIYNIFLSILMTALCAKLVFMARAGTNIIPAVFIIPTINLVAIIFSILLLKNMKAGKRRKVMICKL